MACFLHYASADDLLYKFPGTTSYTPTVSASSGTITSYTIGEATYAKFGTLVFLFVDFQVTNNGTGSGFLRFTAPSGLAPANVATLIGRETAATGWQAFGFWNGTHFNVCKYDGTYAGGTNFRYPMCGFYNV